MSGPPAPYTTPESSMSETFLDPDASLRERGNILYVAPALPTTAREIPKYPLFPSDSAMHLTSVSDSKVVEIQLANKFWACGSHQFHHILTVPASIDVARFQQALSSTLSLFPTFAGRLEHDRPSGTWWIKLSNSTVPIYLDNATGLDPPVDDGWTLAETSLGAFVEPLNLSLLEGSDSPLITVKLSFNTERNETVIGLVVARQLADAYQLLEFTRTLSNHYQGVWLHALPAFHVPSTPDPARNPVSPTTSVLSQRLSHFIFQPGFTPVDAAIPAAVADYQQSDSISLRITAVQSTKLRDIARRQMGHRGEASNISRENAITGFIVSVINEHHPTPVRQIGHTFNLRGTANPKRYGGNAMAFAVTEPLAAGDQTSIGIIALSVSRALSSARIAAGSEANFIAAQEQLQNVANDGLMLSSVVAPGQATVYFDARCGGDWHSAHFGFPGRVIHHSAGYGTRTIRIFHSNPQLGPNHEVIDPRTGTIDVQFRLERSCRDAVAASLIQQLNALGGTG